MALEMKNIPLPLIKKGRVPVAAPQGMRFCTRCKTEKPMGDFANNKSKSDGKSSNCKTCSSETTLAWRVANPEKSKASTENWLKQNQNQEQYLKYSKTWREARRSALSATSMAWARANPARKNALTSKRRAAASKATFGDTRDIQMWYEVAQVLSRGGVKFEVDHIVPLVSNNVCGFHAPWNMTILPRCKNISKGNRWWPDEVGNSVSGMIR